MQEESIILKNQIKHKEIESMNEEGLPHLVKRPWWLWSRWWRKQTPGEQDRVAVLGPLLAVVLFSLAILATLAYLRIDETDRENETVQRDAEFMQQKIRLRMNESQDEILSLARDVGAGEVSLLEFQKRSERLIDRHPELLSVYVLDTQRRVKAIYNSASMFGGQTTAINSVLLEEDKIAGFNETLQRQRPFVSSPTKGPYANFNIFAPFFLKTQINGMIVAEYSLDSLLIHSIPTDLHAKYAVALLAPNGDPLAGTILPERKGPQILPAWLGKVESDASPATPIADGFVLKAQAYRTSLGFVGSGLIWVVGVLSVFTIWMLIGSWRHTRRRVKAQNDLLKETNFRRAMENSMLTGMRALDKQGTITYVNPAFCKMTGWSEKELLNQQAPFPYWPEQDKEELEVLLRDELEGRSTAGGVAMRVQRKDGSIFDARMYVSPLVDHLGNQSGWMASMTDITEPNRAREQLTAAQERFTTVLEGLDAAVSVATVGGDELLFVNAQYRNWFNGLKIGHSDLVAQAGVSTIVPSDGADTVDSLMGLPSDEVTNSEVEQIELFVPELDKWLEIRSRYLSWVDGRLTQLVIASDITARRLAEEQAVKQAEKAQASSRLITMGERASSVAHELNQPLTAINNYCTGMVSRIKDGRIDEESLLNALEKTAHQAQRAGQIIQRIRAFVRRSEPNRSIADVRTMVNEAVELAQIEFRRRRVRMTHFVAANVQSVEADPILIEQVLVNLLKNAAESIDAANRPAALRSVDLKVTQRLVGHQEMIEFEVLDNGKGLPPEATTRLYEAFFSTKAEGMGMGLNLCRSIVESHQGRIEAENLYNGEDVRGCRFVFWLPLVSSNSKVAVNSKLTA